MIDPFYPVVPDSSWVARLVPAGARFVQLRIKDKPDEELRRQVREARDLCAKHGAATSLGTEESSPWERGSSNDVVHGGNYCVVMTGINELFP